MTSIHDVDRDVDRQTMLRRLHIEMTCLFLERCMALLSGTADSPVKASEVHLSGRHDHAQ